MSTPHMSGRSDAPTTDTSDHLDPSDLLDDEGKVDTRKVKGVANSGGGVHISVSPEDCANARAALLDAQTADDAAKRFRFGSSCLREHAKGECHHSESRVSHPPVTHLPGLGWVVEE